MPYSGREVIAAIAARHGWTVDETVGVGHQPHTEVVTYKRNTTQIRITWTRQNSAVGIVKHTENLDRDFAQGPMGLVTARSWLEEPA